MQVFKNVEVEIEEMDDDAADEPAKKTGVKVSPLAASRLCQSLGSSH